MSIDNLKMYFIPDRYIQEGVVYTLVSYKDYDELMKSGWSMRPPENGFEYNSLVLNPMIDKLIEREDKLDD